ncbi:cobyrinic acid ac-diamide synthase [Halorubrum persicum]|uniref:Cobyrinic acid ac-diamide synthase n=1 Tax=Halorubrum persicum TaxID=1383844 RepID=A0A2G1WL38_9EURY|nr:P-loop NTPase [Halorubrum persicum]PHQ39673.1 cobyrinic acid ac-diamide synthase [Halorubrum persicum]
MATVYAVASAKGGVGKTTTTAAVATLLADSGADVVAIDADLGMANLAAAVGVPSGGITLHDVLAGAAEPADAVHEGPSGLRVVPGAADLDAYAAADPSGLRDVVEAFDDADYVLVDAGAGLSHDSTLPLGLADETLLVSTAEQSALGDTEKTRQLTERLGGSVAGAAITRLDPATAADDAPIEAVDRTLDAPVIGRIPDDDAVLRAVESGEPLPVFAPDAPATRAYRDLTRALTGASIDGPGLAAVAPDDEDADDAEAGDAEADDAADGDAGPAETAEADDTEPDDVALGEEDIIVADADRGGLGDPSDEEDIIVAAESPVEDIEEAEGAASDAEDTTDEPAERAGDESSDVAGAPAADQHDAVDGETETVGEDHVDGDDLEAMIESDLDADQFDEGDDELDDSADTDEAAESVEPPASDTPAEPSPSEARDADGESESGPGSEPNDGTDSDPDDELAGSVPFRDDDTGTMNTVLSEEDDDEDDDEGDGGFFSRLLGR